MLMFLYISHLRATRLLTRASSSDWLADSFNRCTSSKPFNFDELVKIYTTSQSPSRQRMNYWETILANKDHS